MFLIPVIREAENGKMAVKGQPEQKLSEVSISTMHNRKPVVVVHIAVIPATLEA
jgi:hypothetical protein